MKLRNVMFSALPLLVPLLLVPASANASTLESGTGSFTATGDIISVKHVDGNTIVTATEVQPLTGVLTGVRVAEGASSGVGNTGDGTIVGYNGTGGLAGLHLQGTFQPVITGPTTAEGPIQVQYHFES